MNKRTTAKAPFGQDKQTGFRTVSRNILLILVFVLMSLPLFTTFNEVLTKTAEKTGTYVWFTKSIVPFETRAVTLILKPFGIEGKPTSSHLYITKDNKSRAIFFSWNCLGWQSAIMLILTLLTGLSGDYALGNKIETILLGISGTFIINLLRISVVVLIAYYFGQLWATIVHDYGGTLFTVAWFFFYWWFSYNFILEERE
jgi:exosortase/archaeosortase family protein